MKRVLDVGQCGADHQAIRRLVASHFEAHVTGADDLDEALGQLRAGSFDLILVNRKLDADGSDGLEVIRRIKAEEAFASIPVMLVTNYRQYQEQAVATGAEMGFGKAHLGAQQTRALLDKFLG